MDERYTLDEARRKLARDECAAHGHDYDIIVEQGTNAPATIVCSRCGEAWTVGQDRTAVVREVVEALRSWAEDCPPTHSPAGAIQAADFIEQSLDRPATSTASGPTEPWRTVRSSMRALHPQTREIRRLADDLDRYRGYVADQSDMERAVGVELRQLADRIIGDMAVQYIDKEHPVVRFPIFRCASCERATVSGLCGCQNPAPMRLDQDPTVAALVGQEILAACTYLVGACRRQLGRRARRRIHVALTNAEGAIAAATWMALPPSCPPSAEKPVRGESGDAFEA